MRHVGALMATDTSAPKHTDGSRVTLRDTLEAAVAAGSESAAAMLEGPELPGEALDVFQWWRELNAQRGSSGFGMGPLLWSEVLAWMQVMKRKPTPGEVSLLLLGDAHYLSGTHDGFATEDDEETAMLALPTGDAHDIDDTDD